MNVVNYRAVGSRPWADHPTSRSNCPEPNLLRRVRLDPAASRTVVNGFRSLQRQLSWHDDFRYNRVSGLGKNCCPMPEDTISPEEESTTGAEPKDMSGSINKTSVGVAGLVVNGFRSLQRQLSWHDDFGKKGISGLGTNYHPMPQETIRPEEESTTGAEPRDMSDVDNSGSINRTSVGVMSEVG
ncbi:hypothetical protein J6590_047017 [Homalodisca vitripennis]|nr:hypothetical protein J6590_047017 [Homalodisca vitripennis]